MTCLETISIEARNTRKQDGIYVTLKAVGKIRQSQPETSDRQDRTLGPRNDDALNSASAQVKVV